MLIYKESICYWNDQHYFIYTSSPGIECKFVSWCWNCVHKVITMKQPTASDKSHCTCSQAQTPYIQECKVYTNGAQDYTHNAYTKFILG